MNIKQNIENLLKNESVSNYKISKETGIAQTTLSDYATGKSKIGNMKLDHAITLNNYWEEIRMIEQIKQAIEYGLSIDWVKTVTGCDTETAAIEELATMYDNEDLTIEQFVLSKLEEDGRVKEPEAFDDEGVAEEQGYYWFDEVDRWINL